MASAIGRAFNPHGSVRVDRLVVVALIFADAAGIAVDSAEGHLTNAAQVVGLSLVAIGCATAFLWRRRRPLLVVAVVVAGFLVAARVHDPPLLTQRTGTQVVLCIYAVASWSNRRRLASSLAAVFALLAGLGTAGDGRGVVAAVSIPVALIGAPWFAGYSARMRRQHLAGVEERLVLAESDREERARRAVADERARIARELHDVVAHHVSLIGVQAGAARVGLGIGSDPVREALTNIELSSREAVSEMRHLLDALGTPDGGETVAPAPGLAEFGHLCDTYLAVGLAVQRSTSGSPDCLPLLHALTLYRIAEEALTNITRHSTATSCSLHLHADTRTARVVVTDPGWCRPRPAVAVAGSGRGLIGMRQRVDMFGGTLTAGPVAGGGFVVDATIPLERQ